MADRAVGILMGAALSPLLPLAGHNQSRDILSLLKLLLLHHGELGTAAVTLINISV